MNDKRLRVLAIATHPVQYQAPLFRRMGARSDIDLHVAYCTLRGAEAAHDPEFGATVKWDVPLLDGYSWTQIPNRGSGNESFWGLRNSGLRELIRKGNFDAILCFVSYTQATFWIAYFAAKLAGTAFLFGTDATTLTSLDGQPWKRHVKGVIWPILFRLADQVIVPSTGSRELIRSLGLASARVTLTPYVVDNDWWLAQSTKADRESTRATWNISSEATVILFCAKLQAWKRPFDLLEAFAQAQPEKSVLLFVGEGPLRTNLESRALALGVADRVRFLGFANQTQLPAIYTAADLMVLPSSYDAFGVVVNEAMLCGCAVAASDHVGAVRDLIIDGETGFVFPCGNVDALAAVLKRAFADRAKLAEMGRRARARMDSWSPRENIEGTVAAMRLAVSRLARFASEADAESAERNVRG